MKFSMVIPVYNEAECITGVVSEVSAAFKRLKICPTETIVVDDGSTDDTPKILATLAKEDNRIRMIRHPINKGIGAANRTGFNAAAGEWVGWLPGDGQINPDEILALYLQHQSADMIVASIKGRQRLQADNLFRLFISQGLQSLIRLITGADGKMTGIFLFKREIFQDIAADMNTGLFNVISPIIAQQRDYRITYAGISLRPRIKGRSKVVNPATILKTFCELLEFGCKKRRARRCLKA